MNPPAASPSVLLVEDNPDHVLLARRAFRKAGLEASLQVAEDGEIAVDWLRDTAAPGLVLLDWKLPRRSGAEVLEWIRADDRLRALPVAVISSSGEREDRQQALDAGANAYIEKPLLQVTLARLADQLGLPWLRGGERPS